MASFGRKSCRSEKVNGRQNFLGAQARARNCNSSMLYLISRAFPGYVNMPAV